MSPTDRPHDLITGEDIEPFWRLLGLNSFAVQFRYEIAGEEFADFEPLAHLTEQLLVHVQSLLVGHPVSAAPVNPCARYA
jgi:hypothetical protein